MPAPDQTVGQRTHLWRPARIIEWHAGRPRVHRMGPDRYRWAGARRETAFTRDQGIDWADYRLDRRFETIPAPATVAELLEVEPDTAVLARHFVFYAGDTPRQLSTSYLPADLVDGTPVADPANEPWPGGTIAQMASLGVTVTDVEETVRARMPTPAETSTLAIADGVPVLTITRRMLAAGRPVEAAADIVIPADKAALAYSMAVAPAAPSPG